MRLKQLMKLYHFNLYAHQMAGERVARTNRQRMLVVTTLAPPTAGERVARTNKQRMLVVTTLAPPTAGETVTRTNDQ